MYFCLLAANGAILPAERGLWGAVLPGQLRCSGRAYARLDSWDLGSGE